MPTDHSRKEEIYLLGGSVDAEIARLSILERLQIETMGGLFAERNNDFSGFTHVLEMESRAATWSLNVARAHPAIEVTCLDRPCSLADYARGQAEAQYITNIVFQSQGDDITQLDFPNHYFDLINASSLFAFVLPQQWQAFIAECLRITRPGGYVRFTECEWGMTSSVAIEQIRDLFLRGLKKMGLGLSPAGHNLGIITMLGYFLELAGWVEIRRHAYIDDYLIGQSVPQDPHAKVQLMANLMSKAILSTGLATSNEMDALLAQAEEEAGRSDFRGIVLYVSFCARKPDRAPDADPCTRVL